MTRIALFILLILPAISFSQYVTGSLDESYFIRQPSARAEAMGRGFVSVDGDMAGVFFNPAAIASISGVVLNGSFASPLYWMEDAKYSFFSAGYRISKYLTIGLSRNHFNFGEPVYLLDNTGTTIDSLKPRNTISSLTIASEPIHNLFVGFNTNLYCTSLHHSISTSKPVYFDFGALKKFSLQQHRSYSHSVNVGASITNFTVAKIKLESVYPGPASAYELPVITRYGANYTFALDKHWLIDTLTTLQALIQMDYKMLLNSEYNSGIHTGGEIVLWELLAMRAGYYEEKIDDYGNPDSNYDKIIAITYGFGVRVPLHKLTKIPLDIRFDYTSLPQVSYSKVFKNWDNFSTYSFSLNWLMN